MSHQPYPQEHDLPPLDANTHLNLSVLRRHNPLITSILSTASYSVLYTFSLTTQTWEKSGIEGSLFVVSLAPDPHTPTPSALQYHGAQYEGERYAVTILNRRGLENFTLELRSAEDVDTEEEIIQIRGDASASTSGVDMDADAAVDGDGQVAYGVWIFSEVGTSTERARDENARVIVECAGRRDEVRERGRRRVEEARRVEEEREARRIDREREAQARGIIEERDAQARMYQGGAAQREQQWGGFASLDVPGDWKKAYGGQNQNNIAQKGSMDRRQLNLLDLFGKPAAAQGPRTEKTARTGEGQTPGHQANGLMDMLRKAQGRGSMI